MKYYVAGPMTGIPQFNVPAFFEAKHQLESAGYEVQLPADLDDPAVVELLLQSLDGAHDPEQTGGLTWGDCLALDVKLIADVVDGVAVIGGWKNSRGASLETYVASLCGKPVVHAVSRRKVSKNDLTQVFSKVVK